MKSYTDIEQSKKLAEILPLESADMRYGYIAPYEYSDRMYEGGYDDVPYSRDFLKKNPNFSEDEYDGEFPCWSLASLLDVLPDDCGIDKENGKYVASYIVSNECGAYKSDNSIDACYEMIIHLHELNLL